MKRFAAAVLAAALLLSAASGCGAPDAARYPLGERISNAGEVVASIREGLGSHARSVTIAFDYGDDVFDELNAVIDEWVELALAETDDPAGGDYIRCRYGGYTYSSSYTQENDRRHYTVRLTPVYYTTPSQEEAVTERVAALLAELGLAGRVSDYEKLRAVYGYLCQSVRYDKVHRKNPYSHLRSTAYAALLLGTATCQGYCAALYRLLREAGIRCRVVTGTAGNTLHAWVIAELDGRYYNLDPTWDAGREEYRYFLVGRTGFADHTPGERFTDPAFTEAYPLSETDYSI